MTGYTKEQKKIEGVEMKKKEVYKNHNLLSVSPYSTFIVCHYLSGVHSCNFFTVNTSFKKDFKSCLFIHLMGVSENTKQIKRMEFSHCNNFLICLQVTLELINLKIVEIYFN